MRVFAAIAIVAIACGGTIAPRPLVRYRNAADAFEIRLSAKGEMAALVVYLHDSKYEIQLWQRGADEQMVGRGEGSIVGVPSERDVLVVDRESTHIGWLREKRPAALGLPRDARWRFVGGSIDHAAHAGTLAFATHDTVIVLELDTQTLAVRGKHELAVWGDTCGATGNAGTLYLWCSEGSGPGERWRVTRYDGRKPAWSSTIDVPPTSGRKEIRGAVTGDNGALVVAHGLAETSRRRFLAWHVRVLDTQDGRVRTLNTPDSLGFLEDFTPVPGRPEVACVRWRYRDFDGILVFDASTLTMRVAVQPDDKLVPLALAVQPDGLFVIP